MTHEINREVITLNDLKEVQSYNKTIPLELNKLKEKTTYVDKIYKILDEFNAKIDYIQLEQKMNLVRGLIQLDKKKEQLAEEQIQNINELIENINELESNIKELLNQIRQWKNISKIDSRNSKQMVLYVKRKRNIM